MKHPNILLIIAIQCGLCSGFGSLFLPSFNILNEGFRQANPQNLLKASQNDPKHLYRVIDSLKRAAINSNQVNAMIKYHRYLEATVAVDIQLGRMAIASQILEHTDLCSVREDFDILEIPSDQDFSKNFEHWEKICAACNKVKGLKLNTLCFKLSAKQRYRKYKSKFMREQEISAKLKKQFKKSGETTEEKDIVSPEVRERIINRKLFKPKREATSSKQGHVNRSRDHKPDFGPQAKEQYGELKDNFVQGLKSLNELKQSEKAESQKSLEEPGKPPEEKITVLLKSGFLKLKPKEAPSNQTQLKGSHETIGNFRWNVEVLDKAKNQSENIEFQQTESQESEQTTEEETIIHPEDREEIESELFKSKTQVTPLEQGHVISQRCDNSLTQHLKSNLHRRRQFIQSEEESDDEEISELA